MAAPKNPDIKLIQRAVQGNRKAFTTLFNKHFHAVYNFALMLSRDPALAEDITQEAFIRAHLNINKLGEPWNFRAWIFRLTRNYFIDQTRKERDVDSLEEDVQVKSTGPTPEKATMSSETADRVYGTLTKLSSQHREILVLRELNQFSYAEIGNILDIGDSNVKVSLHRARAAFQESYGIQLLLEDPEGDCQEVTALLGALHDNELLDQDQFVRDHLKDCPECQERRQILIAQSVAFGAIIPVIPPKALAERILKETGGPPQGPAVQKPSLIKGMFGYGGGVIVLGAMVWVVYSLIFNTRSILPNFPISGEFPPTSEVLAPAPPTEEAAQPPPPPPPPPPSPSPTKDDSCSIFEELEMSLMLLNIRKDDLSLPVYVKMVGGIQGGSQEEGIGNPLWPYSASLGDISANNCNLQGFPDRLYCLFILEPEMPGQEYLFQLKLEHCEVPVYSQMVLLPALPEASHDQPSHDQPVGCHAGLDAESCKIQGGGYKKINDSEYQCFCPP